MSKAIIGALAVAGIFHLLLVIVPIINTLRASISGKSKFVWCAFLVLLPFIGVAIFHFRFKSSLYQGKAYEPTSQELGGPPSGFSRDDNE
ncbi:MAG: hypothetical protein ACR2QW_18675 [bacterium]